MDSPYLTDTLEEMFEAPAFYDDAETKRLARRSFDDPKERVFMWERAGRRCEAYTSRVTRCTQLFEENRNWEGGHMCAFKPRNPKDMPGATDAVTNGYVSCSDCNTRQSNRDVPGWMVRAMLRDRRALSEPKQGAE